MSKANRKGVGTARPAGRGAAPVGSEKQLFGGVGPGGRGSAPVGSMKQLCVWFGLALMSGCVMQPASPGPSYAAPGTYATPPSTQAYAGAPRGRRVTFNAVPLDDRGWQIVAELDAHFGMPLPDGDYWYDP